MEKQKPVDIQKFLDAVADKESSGGKNVNHPTINRGIASGTKASGDYGITKPTADEMLERGDKPEYDYLYDATDKDLANIFKQYKNIPEAIKGQHDPEKYLAETLAKHLANKHNNDVEHMAAGWNYGHNMPTKSLDKVMNRNQDLKDYADFVKKAYEDRMSSVQPEENILDKLIKPTVNVAGDE